MIYEDVLLKNYIIECETDGDMTEIFIDKNGTYIAVITIRKISIITDTYKFDILSDHYVIEDTLEYVGLEHTKLIAFKTYCHLLECEIFKK